MRRVLLVTAFAASFAAVVPAMAQQSTATPPAVEKPGKPVKTPEDPNRMVCTREHVVGSNRPQKVCMTIAERERLRDSSAREVDTTRRPGTQNPGELPGG